MNIKGYVPHIFTSVTINSEPRLKDYTPKRITNNYKTFEQAFIQSGVDEKRFPFFAKLAEKESGFNHDIQNSAGYPAWGYFQFMQGEYNGKKWNNIEDIAGVDVNTFLNNPILQIQAADKLADTFLSQFSQEDKRKARDMGYSDSALVAGAWLAGTGGVRKFLNGNGNPSDVHGTNVAQRMKEFNGYFKRGGVLRFASGGTGPGLNSALNAQSFLPTGHIASNLNLNSDNIFSIYSKPLGKIVDSYGDSLFINSNDYNKDTSIRYLFDIRKDLLNLDIPKESTKDIKSLTDYFKDYIDTHTNGYKKVTKLPDGRDSVAYFDRNKKYLKREGPIPENLNDGEIIRNVGTKMAHINAHALAELWFLYNGISYAKRGIKIKKHQEGGWVKKWSRKFIQDEEPISENPTYIYSSNKKFDINQVASDNVKYDVIVSNRINMASDALRRAGYTNQSDIDRLAYFLAMQSIRETGWVDKDSKNNYGGYMENGRKNTYSSADEFWDRHINNLNNKYKGWDKANNITEYLNTLNDPDWYLRPESEIKAEQSRRDKIGETLWLYTPAYANNGKDYTKEVMDVADRFTYYYLN